MLTILFKKKIQKDFQKIGSEILKDIPEILKSNTTLTKLELRFHSLSVHFFLFVFCFFLTFEKKKAQVGLEKKMENTFLKF